MYKQLPYNGIVRLSGSKSVIQRIMLICSIQETRMEITPGSLCEDVLEMSEALKSLNIMVIATPVKITINSECMLSPDEQTNPVCFKASATAFRFWLARTIISKCETVILISQNLYNRPWKSFIDTLNSLGCRTEITESKDSEYPYKFVISPPEKTQEEFISADCSQSSQFISGLMLVAPRYSDVLSIKFVGKHVSMDYLKLTFKLMNSLGLDCKFGPDCVTIRSEQGYGIPQLYQIEPDISTAAFFLSLGAFSKKGVKFETVCNTRWQPDWHFLNILKEMGVEVIDCGQNIYIREKQLHGIKTDMQNNPDIVPILAVLALFADTESVLYNIGHLKHKESDRISGIAKALSLIDAKYNIYEDNLEIFPLEKPPNSVTLDTQTDHRLTMAFTLLQLHFPQVFLSETQSVEKSSSDFYILLKNLQTFDEHK